MKPNKKQKDFINKYLDNIQIYPYMGKCINRGLFKLPTKIIYQYNENKYFIKIFKTNNIQIYINRFL